MKNIFLSLLFFIFSGSAHAVLLSDSVSLGAIGDTDSDPGVAFSFDLGGTFSSISTVTFTFDPCNGCQDTIGTAEDVILDLGPDSFTIGNVGLGNTIVEPLAFSASLGSDLLDGIVSGYIWLHEQAGSNFDAGVVSADITLAVEGEAGGRIPTPAPLALIGLGLAVFGLARKRRSA